MRNMRFGKVQRGEGKAGCIFWLLILGVGLLAGFRFVPAKIADIQLLDHVDELAKLYPRKDARFFRTEIFKRADELRIPLDKKEIKVDKTQHRVRVKYEYEVVMDFIFFEYVWKRKHDFERDIFIM